MVNYQKEERSMISCLEKTTDGVVVIDGKKNILFVNSSAERLLGKKKEDLIGKKFELTEIGDKPSDIRLILDTGEVKYLRIKFVEGKWINKSVHFVLLQDITHLKLEEERLQKIIQDLLRLIRASTRVKDLESFAREVGLSILDLLQGDICLFYLYEKKYFRPIETVGLDSDLIPYFVSERLTHKDSIIKKLLKEKKPTILDYSFLRTKKKLRWIRRIKKAILIPLIVRKEIRGLLIVLYRKEKDLSEIEKKIIEGIAYIGTEVLQNVNLYRRLVNKSIELSHSIKAIETIHEIDKAILSSLNQQTILEIVAAMVTRLIDCNSCAITILDKEKKALIFKAGFGRRRVLKRDTAIPLEDTIANEVIETGRFQYISELSDLEELPAFEKKMLKEGFHSIIRIPLKARGRIIGILSLESKRSAAFTSKDISLLETLSNQVGVALENANLLNEFEELFIGTLRAFSKIIDAKSPWTRGHSERVTKYAILIGRELGLSRDQLRRLEVAALLHDIGKIGIPESILDKPGKLTKEEYEIVKRHPEIGAEILSSIRQFEEVVPAIRHHHERYDGRGYPDGLKGEEIPVMARIIAVADAFDAMLSKRPYRDALSLNSAVKELQRNKGSQFDPQIVDILLNIIPDLLNK